VSGKTKNPRLSPDALSALSLITDQGKRQAFLRRRKLFHADVIHELNAATLK
jgi:hypothetical protein